MRTKHGSVGTVACAVALTGGLSVAYPLNTGGNAGAPPGSVRQAGLRSPPSPPNQAGPSLMLTNAWLIDGTGASAVEGAWIRIADGRITEVGRGPVPAAAGARVLNLQGRTVLPGLSDMHVHLGDLAQARWMLKLLLAHGVTNVKDAGNTLGNLAGIRRWMAGDRQLPHLFVSGATLNGSEADLQFLPAGGRTQALLENNLAFGVDFIKIHNWISSFALKQIAAFCKVNDLYLTGHVPLSVTSVAAIDAGMTILEHVRVQQSEVLDDPQAIARFPLDLVVMRRTGYWALMKPENPVVRATLDAWEQRKDRFFSDPTLVVQEALAFADNPANSDAPDMRLVSPAMAQEWPEAAKRYGDLSGEEFALAKGSVKGMSAFIGAAHRRGVRILTGTDTPVPYVVPGASLLRELELLVQAGLSPIEAVRSSTGLAAAALRNRERGLIAPGQVADLVIVRGNVAADIRAIRNIERVMIGGELLDRDRLLADAARLAEADLPAKTPPRSSHDDAKQAPLPLSPADCCSPGKPGAQVARPLPHTPVRQGTHLLLDLERRRPPVGIDLQGTAERRVAPTGFQSVHADRH